MQKEKKSLLSWLSFDSSIEISKKVAFGDQDFFLIAKSSFLFFQKLSIFCLTIFLRVFILTRA